MVDVVAYLFMASWSTLGLKIIIIKERNSMVAIKTNMKTVLTQSPILKSSDRIRSTLALVTKYFPLLINKSELSFDG